MRPQPGHRGQPLHGVQHDRGVCGRHAESRPHDGASTWIDSLQLRMRGVEIVSVRRWFQKAFELKASCRSAVC